MVVEYGLMQDFTNRYCFPTNYRRISAQQNDVATTLAATRVPVVNAPFLLTSAASNIVRYRENTESFEGIQKHLLSLFQDVFVTKDFRNIQRKLEAERIITITHAGMFSYYEGRSISS